MKSSKKQYLKTLRKIALKLWSQVVKKRSNYTCEICGIENGTLNAKNNSINLNAHHVESKENESLRFDIINGVALCPGCHTFSINSAHRSPVFFLDWLLNNRPEVIPHIRLNRNKTKEVNAGYWKRDDLIEHIKILNSYMSE